MKLHLNQESQIPSNGSLPGRESSLFCYTLFCSSTVSLRNSLLSTENFLQLFFFQTSCTHYVDVLPFLSIWIDTSRIVTVNTSHKLFLHSLVFSFHISHQHKLIISFFSFSGKLGRTKNMQLVVSLILEVGLAVGAAFDFFKIFSLSFFFAVSFWYCHFWILIWFELLLKFYDRDSFA